MYPLSALEPSESLASVIERTLGAPTSLEEISAILKSAKKTLIVEANYSGQLERLIRQETGISIQHNLHKFDGEPFGPAMVYEKIKAVLKDKKVPELAAR